MLIESTSDRSRPPTCVVQEHRASLTYSILSLPSSFAFRTLLVLWDLWWLLEDRLTRILELDAISALEGSPNNDRDVPALLTSFCSYLCFVSYKRASPPTLPTVSLPRRSTYISTVKHVAIFSKDQSWRLYSLQNDSRVLREFKHLVEEANRCSQALVVP